MKHIYFSDREKVDQGNIDIVHSPSDSSFPEDQIWTDLPTKPKSGRLFYEDRSVHMNCLVNYVNGGEFDKDSDRNKPEEFILSKVGLPHQSLMKPTLLHHRSVLAGLYKYRILPDFLFSDSTHHC